MRRSLGLNGLRRDSSLCHTTDKTGWSSCILFAVLCASSPLFIILRCHSVSPSPSRKVVYPFSFLYRPLFLAKRFLVQQPGFQLRHQISQFQQETPLLDVLS